MLATETPNTPAVPTTTPRQVRNVALWVLQGLLAALFAFAGVNKLLGIQPEVVESFGRMGFGDGFRYFTGVVELVGAIGLLIPRLSRFAAVWLAGVMVGAIVIHLTVLPPAALAIPPAILVGLFALIAYARWPRV